VSGSVWWVWIGLHLQIATPNVSRQSVMIADLQVIEIDQVLNFAERC
jgi:hypothetical protein